jgi:hypothetical protein
MAAMDLQDRAQYLSLALFSQAIVSVLMEYVDEGKTSKLRATLGEALRSLKQAQNPQVHPQADTTVLTSYEHLRTLEEVWRPEVRAEVIRKIERVLTGSKNQKTKTVANELIGLFSKLQVQALWNFEQPRPVSPKAIQRLCRLA